MKWRALRLDTGNYSWGSEAVTRKTRILDVGYYVSNNELVRTKTLVKSSIVLVDASPFKQWYLTNYGVDIGRKKKTPTAKKDAAEVCFLATESLLLTLSSVRNWLHCSHTIFCRLQIAAHPKHSTCLADFFINLFLYPPVV